MGSFDQLSSFRREAYFKAYSNWSKSGGGLLEHPCLWNTHSHI